MRTYFRLLYSFCGLLVLASVVGLGSVAAATSNISGAVAQSYNADPSVLPEMIVELKPQDPKTVIPLTSQDIHIMFGVVVPANGAAIVLTPQSVSTQQVLVATSGNYNLLVSNEDGAIKAGDYLTASSLAGIGMKANATQTEIVGQAVGNFSGSSNVLGSESVKGSTGSNITASIGSIPVTVRLAANPLYQKSSTELPGFLSKTANSVANKHVSTARIYLGTFILLATMLITGSMLYSGVNSSVTAVGRNPLAKKAIGRSLFQIIATGLLVLISGILAAYLILRL